MLNKIVDQVLQPARGPVCDPAFAYRGLKEDEVTEQDLDILNELEEELKEKLVRRRGENESCSGTCEVAIGKAEYNG